jgi:hypothetical protein
MKIFVMHTCIVAVYIPTYCCHASLGKSTTFIFYMFLSNTEPMAQVFFGVYYSVAQDC